MNFLRIGGHRELGGLSSDNPGLGDYPESLLLSANGRWAFLFSFGMQR